MRHDVINPELSVRSPAQARDARFGRKLLDGVAAQDLVAALFDDFDDLGSTALGVTGAGDSAAFPTHPHQRRK